MDAAAWNEKVGAQLSELFGESPASSSNERILRLPALEIDYKIKERVHKLIMDKANMITSRNCTIAPYGFGMRHTKNPSVNTVARKQKLGRPKKYKKRVPKDDDSGKNSRKSKGKLKEVKSELPNNLDDVKMEEPNEDELLADLEADLFAEPNTGCKSNNNISVARSEALQLYQQDIEKRPGWCSDEEVSPRGAKRPKDGRILLKPELANARLKCEKLPSIFQIREDVVRPNEIDFETFHDTWEVANEEHFDSDEDEEPEPAVCKLPVGFMTKSNAFSYDVREKSNSVFEEEQARLRVGLSVLEDVLKEDTSDQAAAFEEAVQNLNDKVLKQILNGNCYGLKFADENLETLDVSSRLDFFRGKYEEISAEVDDPDEEFIVTVNVSLNPEVKGAPKRMEIECLGSNTLGELREAIWCEASYQPFAALSKSSATFFIDGCFYSDLSKKRKPGEEHDGIDKMPSSANPNFEYCRVWEDYGKSLLKGNFAKTPELLRENADKETKDMNTTKIKDLPRLPVGAMGLFIHCCDCEHRIVFDAVRKYDKSVDLKFQSQYPLKTFAARTQTLTTCQLCKRNTATIKLYNDPWMPLNSVCEYCFVKFHMSEKDGSFYNFLASWENFRLKNLKKNEGGIFPLSLRDPGGFFNRSVSQDDILNFRHLFFQRPVFSEES